jgi:hypothetical protein
MADKKAKNFTRATLYTPPPEGKEREGMRLITQNVPEIPATAPSGVFIDETKPGFGVQGAM